MSSLYSQYIKEREGSKILENEDGFLTYITGNGWIFIQDIFVTKEKRNSKLATQMADTVIEEEIKNGAKILYSHVDTKALNWQDSVKFIEAYGCKMIKYDESNDLLYFQKKLG